MKTTDNNAYLERTESMYKIVIDTINRALLTDKPSYNNKYKDSRSLKWWVRGAKLDVNALKEDVNALKEKYGVDIVKGSHMLYGSSCLILRKIPLSVNMASILSELKIQYKKEKFSLCAVRKGTVENKKRQAFIELLAAYIQEEAQSSAKYSGCNEPYRAAGDALVDDALQYID